MINDATLGFARASVTVDGKVRPVARFACTECQSTTDVSMKSGETLNPEGLADTARQRGWSVDAYRKQRCRCPLHTNRHRANDTDSELRKFEAKMAPPPAPITLLRDPTSDQRALIRKLLEAHYDEDRGCYLDGYSDQRVADEAKIARAAVEQLREVAYGPIRISAETLALQTEVAAFKQQLADHLSAAGALLATIEAETKQLRQRAVAIEAKLGKVAA